MNGGKINQMFNDSNIITQNGKNEEEDDEE